MKNKQLTEEEREQLKEAILENTGILHKGEEITLEGGTISTILAIFDEFLKERKKIYE